MKKLLSFFLCAGILAFLLLSPTAIGAGLGKSIYRAREAAGYRGSLEFWHIVRFKTPAGSGYDYLRGCCRAFEREMPYVYVTLRGMTVEEAQRRMSEGEMPDAVSYPAGVLSEAGMLAYDAAELLPCVEGIGEKAQPYMMDSYVLLLNEALYEGYETDFERIYEILSEEEILPLAVTRAGGAAPQLLLPTDEPPAAAEEFFAGNVGMYLCTYAETVAKRQEIGFPTRILAPDLPTDAIQLLGIYDSGDKAKNELLQRLAEGFFTERMQRKLEQIGMLACTRVENLYKEDVARAQTYRRFCEKTVPFAHGLW